MACLELATLVQKLKYFKILIHVAIHILFILAIQNDL